MSLFGGITLSGRPDLENIRRLDQLPVPLMRQMQRYGFAVDREHFSALSSQLAAQMKDLRAEICSYIPEEKLDEFIGRSNLNADDDYLPMNVESGAQLANLLFDVLGIGADRQLKRTKGGQRISTGKKQLELLKRKHPVVQVTLNYRECAKLKSVYADKLPKMAVQHLKGSSCPVCELPHVESTWRVHTTLLDTRTATGRLASKNPNLQTIPSRTALGRQTALGFVASPGTVLVSCDFAQEEMRNGAHYSSDPELIRIFSGGLDPHSETARKIFDIPADKQPDKLSQRDPARHVNFGIFYGLTPPGLFDQLGVTYATAGMEMPDWLTEEWAGGLIEDWFKVYAGVKEYLEQQTYRARRYGIVWTLFGRVRRVPEVKSVHRRIQAAGLRQAGNMPIQGTGGDMMRLVMGEMATHPEIKVLIESGVWVWPLMTIHDDLKYEVDEDYGSLVGSILKDVFENVFRDKDSGEWLFRVPIKADAKVSLRWEK